MGSDVLGCGAELNDVKVQSNCGGAPTLQALGMHPPLILSTLIYFLTIPRKTKTVMQIIKTNPVNFRYFKKNMQSIAVLLPLLPGSDIAEEPCEGIMIYSFSSPQAQSIFREVKQSKIRPVLIAGGPHPSARPEETLQYFDYVRVCRNQI